MKLYNGLPLKRITFNNNNGIECSFGVTTDIVDDLITIFLTDFNFETSNFYAEVEEFDNNYNYAVPQHIFDNKDDEITIKYINKNINTFYLNNPNLIKIKDEN